ncbi:MAG TPA: ferric reductase-like transmembrane domain-containing protein [Candidatus Dormibacteraeota bacterium]
MSSEVLWFATRAAGVVSLLLFTAVVVMGQLARLRVESATWPRFLSVDLHRNLALLSLVFLAIHIVTAVADPFTSLGVAPVVLPFGSSYRRFWLGLGTVAFELTLAVIATSLLRARVGVRVWRTVHWLSYAAWPIAVVHGLGTGTDSFSPWLLAVTMACVGAVVVVTVWRLLAAPPDPLRSARRLAAERHRVSGS